MEAATQFPYKGAISGKASPRGKGDSHVVCLDGKADVPADIELVVTPNPVADEHLPDAEGEVSQPASGTEECRSCHHQVPSDDINGKSKSIPPSPGQYE